MPAAGKKWKAGKPKEEKQNPFDVKVNRRKHNVVDPRRKKTEFNVTNARDRADELRKQTLMVEYSQKDKANTFVDRRFGEDDASMPEEDAMLMRYQKEKARQIRKSRRDYSIEDGEELTHMGSALAEDGAGFAPSDEDSDAEGDRLETQLDKQNFGGFEKTAEETADGVDEEGRVKTKKEVMAEIITKSKKHKAELARAKEEKENLVDELDEEFKDIMGLLQDRHAPVDRDAPRKEKTEQEKEWDADAKEYNLTKNLLVNELRSKPSDRMKSEDELAREARERLDKLEAARLRRMNGEGDEEGDADLMGDGAGVAAASGPAAGGRRTGDELDDDLGGDEAEEEETVRFKDGAMVTADTTFSDGEDEDDAEDCGSEQGSDGDDTYDNEGRPERGGMKPTFISGTEINDRPDPSATGTLWDELGDVRGSRITRVPVEKVERPKRGYAAPDSAAAESQAQKKLGKASAAVSDLDEAAAALPFVFDCPTTVEAWAVLAAGKPAALQSIILDRIRACHHVSLAAENRAKLQRLYTLLWKLVQETASAPAANGSMSAEERLETITMLSTHVLAMSPAMPEFAGAVAIKYLRAIQSGHSQACDVDTDGEFGWPPAGAMMVLHLCAVVFPTSDLVHPVTTPAILVGSAILAQSIVKTSADVLRGLFLCAWSLRIHQEPRRLSAETLAWLVRMLDHALVADPTDDTEEATEESGDVDEEEAELVGGGKKGKKRKAAAVKAGGKGGKKGAKRARVEESKESNFGATVTSALSELRGLGCTGTRLSNEQELTQLLQLDAPPVAKKKKKANAAAAEELPVDEAGEITPVPLGAMLDGCAAEEAEAGSGSSPSYVLRAQCIGCAMRLLRQLVRMFHGCDSAAEVLKPLHACLGARSGAIAALPPALNALAAGLATAAEAAVTSCAKGRQPLEYLRRAPVAIRQMNPKWEDGKKARGFAGLTTGPTAQDEKDELKKLQREQKKEMRGAAKELRKDSASLTLTRSHSHSDSHSLTPQTKADSWIANVCVCFVRLFVLSAGAMLGRQRLEEWKTMRKRDNNKTNEIMNILQTQQSEYGKGSKKFHKK